MTQPHRIAVSILLTPDGNTRQVYLVHRNPALAFFGDYLAFPGGTLEADDRRVRVRHAVSPAGVPAGDYGVFVAAAARELFEETGVWIARGERRPDPGSLRAHRRRLVEEGLPFSHILEQERQWVDARDLTSICRITTPPFTPRRYDTWFLHCRIPPGSEAPEVWPGELESGHFVDAGRALQQWRRGGALIVPPVVILLRELASRGWEEFLGSVRRLTQSYDRGKLHQIFFSCGVILAPLETRTRPPAAHTNAYLVGEKELYLIDPGAEAAAEQEKLWELLDELRGEGKRLRAILLTHHHPDHTGAVQACQERYGLPLLAHRETAARLPGYRIDGFLEDGQELELGAAPDGTPDWRLRVHHAPGHAAGHVVFQESRYAALLAGDMVSTLSSVLIDPDEGSMSRYVESLQRLEGLAGGVLYPAHGPPARDGRAEIRKALEHRRRREQVLLGALRQSPQSLDALLAVVYQDVDAGLLELARRSLRAGLIKLCEEQRAEETPEGYRRR